MPNKFKNLLGMLLSLLFSFKNDVVYEYHFDFHNFNLKLLIWEIWITYFTI